MFSIIDRKKAFRIAIISVILVFAIILPIFPFSTLAIAYEIKLDNKSIGFVSNTEQFNKVKTTIDNNSVGSVTEEVEVSATIVPKVSLNTVSQASQSLTENLKDVDNIVSVYGIYADGICIAASENKELLLNAIEAYKSQMQAKKDADIIVFNKNITVEECLSLTEKLSTLEDAIKTIEQNVGYKYGYYKTYTKNIKFNTIKKTDDNLYEGITVVESEGVKGEQEITQVVFYNFGEKSHKEIVKTVVISQPIDKVVIKGTKERPQVDLKGGEYLWPLDRSVSCYVSSPFGPRSGRNHDGLDIITNYGEQILAANDGVVIRASWFDGYGYCVDIQHKDGAVSRYAHCSSLDVQEGQQVVMGQVIARVGSTGRSTANHIHFEIMPDGCTPVNPYNYVVE